MMRMALFDMDGTIFSCKINWRKVRAHIQISDDSILGAIYQQKDPESLEKMRYIESIERENTICAKIRPGIGVLLNFLKKNRIYSVLVTNNSEINTRYLLTKHNISFELIITRESGKWKPDPAPFFLAFQSFGVRPEETISIGDSLLDIQASRAAGISEIYIIKSRNTPKAEGIRVVKGFTELKRLILPEGGDRMSTCRHHELQNIPKPIRIPEM